MSSGAGIHPYGSRFQYSATAPTGLVNDLGSIKDIDPPSVETAKVRITNMQSPSATHEYTPGMIEPGEVSFDFFWSKAEFALVLSFLRLVQYYQIVYPPVGAEVNASRYYSQGFLIKIDTDNMVVDGEDAIMCPATIAFTGPGIFVQGS